MRTEAVACIAALFWCGCEAAGAPATDGAAPARVVALADAGHGSADGVGQSAPPTPGADGQHSAPLDASGLDLGAIDRAAAGDAPPPTPCGDGTCAGAESAATCAADCASSEVYLAAFGDADAQTSGTTRGAIDAFFATATAGQKKAIVIAGDVSGAGATSGRLSSYAKIYDKYFADLLRWILPIPGNHDSIAPDDQPTLGAYYGFFTYFTQHNAAGQWRPADLGLHGAHTTGRFWYAVDLTAADGTAYWKAILVNDQIKTDTAEIQSALQGYLDAAAAHSPPQHVLLVNHKPLWDTNGGRGEANDDLWDRLQGYGAGMKVSIVGHIHKYARFKPLERAGNVTAAPSYGQALRSAAQYAKGTGVIQVLAGLGGQNPAGDANDYVANVAECASCRASHKAIVIGPHGPANTPPDTSTDANAQQGHPYGAAGIILGKKSVTFSFFGNRARWSDPPDVYCYDGPVTFDWGP